MPASIPRNEKLGLSQRELTILHKALAIARKHIAEAPTITTGSQEQIINKLCDLRNAATGIIALETGTTP